MKDMSLSPRVKTVRTVQCFHWFHKDGTRCTTPHDLCTEEHLDPVLAWTDVSENLITTAGLNALLDNTFNAAVADVLFYCGLVNNASFTAYAAGDTLASHSGWLEGTPYSGNRPAWTKNGAASSGAMSNSSAKASYSINATLTIRGAFLCKAASGTTGLLYGAGDFSATRSVASGDTLTLQVDLSATSS